MIIFKMEDLKIFLQIINGNLHKWYALIAGIIFEAVFLTVIDGLIEKFIQSPSIRGSLYFVLLLFWVLVWLNNRFVYPKNVIGKVGIVVAIYAESETERNRLKADFVRKLKEMFSEENISELAEIIFLKNHFAEQIVDSNSPKKEIEQINQKIGAHLYIWGDIKKRLNGESGDVYSLAFHGYVVHKPITMELSSDLAKDFSSILPREINFSEREFKGFEVSAKMIHLAIKYIIGLAAFVSQDPQLAFTLHNGLQEKFNLYRPLPVHIQRIRDRIPILLSEEALWISKWHYTNMRVEDAKSYLSVALKNNNQNYGMWLMKSILDFNDGNISAALKSINSAKKSPNANVTWRYNEAFLFFWTGKYDKAILACDKLKKISYIEESLLCKEVREFNLNILQTDKEHPQVYYWIGYLSYFKENNLCNALEDFENFHRFADETMNILKAKSEVYLREIRQKMS